MIISRIRLQKSAFCAVKNHKILPNQSIIHPKPFSTDIFNSIPGMIQGYVTGMHHMTGLPWWATIAASTSLVRLALFPIVRYQYIHVAKLAGAMPELNFLAQLLSHRLHSIKRSSPMSSWSTIMSSDESQRILGIFIKGVRACLVIHNVQMSYIFGLPIFNLVTFITFIYSLRQMILGDQTETMQEGGLSWFSNLQEKDETFILPLAALSLSYSAIELSFYMASHTTTAVGTAASNVANTGGKYILYFKDLVQSIIIFSIPFVLPLPSGIYCYWIPSSLLTTAQVLLMRTEWFRKLIRVPLPPVPPHLKPPSTSVISHNSGSTIKNTNLINNSSGIATTDKKKVLTSVTSTSTPSLSPPTIAATAAVSTATITNGTTNKAIPVDIGVSDSSIDRHSCNEKKEH